MKPADVAARPAGLDQWIDRRISDDDQMFTGNEEHYFGCGRDAVHKIASIQTMLGMDAPSTILDFACGHGRVGRYLRAAYQEADLVGCDVMARALPFYEETFRATVIETSRDLAEVDLGRRFDLIWTGSLMTHFDESQASDLLALFDRHLADDGIAVFTTHGRFVANKWRTGSWPYKLDEDSLRAISDIFDAGDYSYSDYDHMAGYGISMTPLAWVMRQLTRFPELRLVTMVERGWDDHQDLVAVRRRSVATS